MIAGGSGGSIEAPGRAQTGTTCRLAFLMGVDCQKCFCVTFDESNKAYGGLDAAPYLLEGGKTIERSISGMVGKGSLTHNSRAFKAENVKADYTRNNIEYCNENIKEVYHELFHEVIFQVGNKDDMNVQSENGKLAKNILDDFMSEFQSGNPNLRVFSAHLHMDEETPHLHIDFVPFTTGSKRGMDTRVSLKQALAD